MSEVLSREHVERVAKLARLALTPEQVERFGKELSSILEHVARLQSVDVTNVEPMAHPTELTNRMDEDVPRAAMPLEDVLANAPSTEQAYLAVPKVLDEGGG